MIGAKNCYMSASNIYGSGSYSGSRRYDYGYGRENDNMRDNAEFIFIF